jgi:D-alanyl-D-alanine carboxypeptidase
MVAAAAKDELPLKPFSGFRSYIHQKGLIAKHLANGRSLEAILTHIAIPGYSEHHTGRAVDIFTGEKYLLEETFDQTPEFEWLSKNAGRFGFLMSYPRENPFGIIYEPWHWCFQASHR